VKLQNSHPALKFWPNPLSPQEKLGMGQNCTFTKSVKISFKFTILGQIIEDIKRDVAARSPRDEDNIYKIRCSSADPNSDAQDNFVQF